MKVVAILCVGWGTCVVVLVCVVMVCVVVVCVVVVCVVVVCVVVVLVCWCYDVMECVACVACMDGVCDEYVMCDDDM